jgi:cytoskeletal protein CcmA (bactofilin family)
MINFKKLGYSALAASLISLSPAAINSSDATTTTITSSDIWGDASNLGDGNSVADPTAGDSVVINGAAVVLSFSDTDGDAKAVGALTGSGSVLVNANVTTNLAQSVATVAIGANMTLQQSANSKASATMNLTSTSVVHTIGGTLAITSVDANADDHDLLLNVLGGLTVTGATTLTSARGATGGNGADAKLVIDKAATFTGGVTLTDGASPGKAHMIFEQNNAATITGVINGADNGEGLLEVDGNTKTFASAIGTTKTVGEVQVDGGTAVFNGAVKTALLDINGTTTMNGAVTVTTTNVDAVTTFASTLTATTYDINAAVTNTGNVVATNVTVDANAAFNGDVTAAIAVDTANAVVTIAGDITGAISQSTTSNKLVYDAAAAQSQTGALTAIADGDGIVNVKNTDGLVTFTAAIGTASKHLKEIDSDASTKSRYNVAFNTDLLTLDGQVTLQVVENDASDINFGANSSLILEKTILKNTNVFDDVTTDFSVASGAKIYAPVNLVGGTALIFADGTNGTADDTTVTALLSTALVDSALIDYTMTVDGDNNENDLNAVYKSATTTASELNTTTNTALAFKQAYLAAVSDTNVDDTLEDVFEGILLNSTGNTAYSATSDTDVAKQIAPQQDLIAGSTFAASANTGAVQGVISNRLASLRSGDAYVAGMSAGAGPLSTNSMFLQAYGSIVAQDDKIVGSGHQAGYDADTAGFAIGVDGISEGGLVLGLSLAIGQTDLNGKGTGKAKNDIDNYSASFYMDKATENGYLEGSVTYGLNNNSASRIINTAGLDRTLKADYDTQQLSVKVGGGVPYEANNGTLVTPFASVTGTIIENDAYTETSDTANDNLRLRVSQDPVNSILGTIGIKASYESANGGVPMASIAFNNEFGDNQIVSSNKYQGGGTKFKTHTAVEEVSATLGLGYTFTNGNTDMNVGYEATANDDDYFGHYGTVKFTTKF